MRRADRITGLIGFIFSAFVVTESWKLRQPVMAGRITYEPGAEFLPLWAAILMAVLSLLLMVSAAPRPIDPDKNTIFPRGQSLFAVLILMAVLAVYILLLDVLGYLVGTLLLNLCLMRVVMRAEWKSTLPVSLLASVTLYLIFQVALNVNLPKNMFGF